MRTSTPHRIGKHVPTPPAIDHSGGGADLRVRPLRALAQDVRHFRRLEQAGESEWTPWIVLAGLFLLLTTIYFLVLGLVEGVADLLARGL